MSELSQTIDNIEQNKEKGIKAAKSLKSWLEYDMEALTRIIDVLESDDPYLEIETIEANTRDILHDLSEVSYYGGKDWQNIDIVKNLETLREISNNLNDLLNK